MRRAIFPGTFDPFTIGHYSIVQRGLSIFDEIIIGIGVNQFKTLFDDAKRLDIIEQAFADEPRVKAMVYNSLTIDFAKSVEAGFILRDCVLLPISSTKEPSVTQTGFFRE